jgi:hypothetical protein
MLFHFLFEDRGMDCCSLASNTAETYKKEFMEQEEWPLGTLRKRSSWSLWYAWGSYLMRAVRARKFGLGTPTDLFEASITIRFAVKPIRNPNHSVLNSVQATEELW